MNRRSETVVFRERSFQENKDLSQDVVVSAVKTHPETFGLRVVLTAWTKAIDCTNPCEDPYFFDVLFLISSTNSFVIALILS